MERCKSPAWIGAYVRVRKLQNTGCMSRSGGPEARLEHGRSVRLTYPVPCVFTTGHDVARVEFPLVKDLIAGLTYPSCSRMLSAQQKQ